MCVTGFSNLPVGSTSVTCPLQQNQTPTYWIEIEFFDGAGKPVRGACYSVVLPDQQIARGTLDEAGFARLDGIPVPGMCKVSFPEYDKDTWNAAEVLPSKSEERVSSEMDVEDF